MLDPVPELRSPRPDLARSRMAWAIAAALAAVLMADLPSGWGISGDLDGCTRRGAAYRLSTAEARRADASLQASPSPGRHDFLVAESRGAASMVDASEQLERGHAIPTTL